MLSDLFKIHWPIPNIFWATIKIPWISDCVRMDVTMDVACKPPFALLMHRDVSDEKVVKNFASPDIIKPGQIIFQLEDVMVAFDQHLTPYKLTNQRDCSSGDCQITHNVHSISRFDNGIVLVSHVLEHAVGVWVRAKWLAVCVCEFADVLVAQVVIGQ